jgi:endonuclease/exonuclease/phosphatase family metal-dependent hydrolase
MLTALTLMTFNFWGLPQIGTLSLSLLKHERQVVLCSKLKTLAETNAADVIALQEVWEPRDRDALKQCGFTYSVDLNDPARLIDSGLLILSRYPLSAEAPVRVKYPKPDSRGAPSFDGESSADKSVMVARFQLPNGKTFVVGDTHLISSYTHYPQYDQYQALRNKQFGIAVDTVKAYRKDEAEPAFLLGDFNTGPVVDQRANTDWPTLTHDLDYDRAQENSCTVCLNNPFQDGTEERMDFVFSIANPALTRVSESRDLDQQELLQPGITSFLSDHFAWKAKYQIQE